MTVQSPSPGLSGVGGSFSYSELLQGSTGKRMSVDGAGRVSGSSVESVVVGGAGLPCVFEGADGEREGATVVVIVAVEASGGGVVAPVGSKLKRGSPKGKLLLPS